MSVHTKSLRGTKGFSTLSSALVALHSTFHQRPKQPKCGPISPLSPITGALKTPWPFALWGAGGEGRALLPTISGGRGCGVSKAGAGGSARAGGQRRPERPRRSPARAPRSPPTSRSSGTHCQSGSARPRGGEPAAAPADGRASEDLRVGESWRSGTAPRAQVAQSREAGSGVPGNRRPWIRTQRPLHRARSPQGTRNWGTHAPDSQPSPGVHDKLPTPATRPILAEKAQRPPEPPSRDECPSPPAGWKRARTGGQRLQRGPTAPPRPAGGLPAAAGSPFRGAESGFGVPLRRVAPLAKVPCQEPGPAHQCRGAPGLGNLGSHASPGTALWVSGLRRESPTWCQRARCSRADSSRPRLRVSLAPAAPRLTAPPLLAGSAPRPRSDPPPGQGDSGPGRAVSGRVRVGARGREASPPPSRARRQPGAGSGRAPGGGAQPRRAPRGGVREFWGTEARVRRGGQRRVVHLVRAEPASAAASLGTLGKDGELRD